MGFDDLIPQILHNALRQQFDRDMEVCITRDDARLFSIAVDDPDPRTHDLAAAQSAGYTDVIICPALLTTTAGRLAADIIHEVLGLKSTRLHTFDPSLLYFNHACAEVALLFSLRFEDCYIDPSGSSGIFIVSSHVSANEVGPVAEVSFILKAR